MWACRFNFLLKILQKLSLMPCTTASDQVCTSNECQKAAATFRYNMNTDVHPCHDFHEYVCGKFRENALSEFPYKSHVTAYDFGNRESDQILLNYMKNMDDKAPPSFLKIRSFFQSCMDEEKIGKQSLQEAEKKLDIVGLLLEPPFHRFAAPTLNVANFIAKIQRFVIPSKSFLFDTSVEVYWFDKTRNVLLIKSTQNEAVSKGLRMENGKYFRSLTTDNSAILRDYMMKVLSYLYGELKVQLDDDDVNTIWKRVGDVSRFLTDLEKIRKSAPMGEKEIYGNGPFFQKQFNDLLEGGEIKFDFMIYLETLYSGILNAREYFGKENNINVAQSNNEEIKLIFGLLQQTSPTVLLTAAWWEIMDVFFEDGPEPIRLFRNEFQQAVSGTTECQPREIMCIRKVRSYFGWFDMHVLAKTINGPKVKEKVEKITKNLKETFVNSINKIHWMDAQTKKASQKKIEGISSYVGFSGRHILNPSVISNYYKNVDVDPENFLITLNQFRQNSKENDLKSVTTTNDISKKPTSTAYCPIYWWCYNHMTVSVASMFQPTYDHGLEALNYGAIGGSLAHEMGHAFDPRGYQLNEKSEFPNGWTEDSSTKYKHIFQHFIATYNKIQIKYSKHFVDGEKTLAENLADWYGFNVALSAYRRHVKKHGPGRKLINFEDLSHEQLFTIAWASLDCVAGTPEYFENDMGVDVHAPEMERVNTIARNSEEFSKIWGCDASSPMNPSDKCDIWKFKFPEE